MARSGMKGLVVGSSCDLRKLSSWNLNFLSSTFLRLQTNQSSSLRQAEADRGINDYEAVVSVREQRA